MLNSFKSNILNNTTMPIGTKATKRAFSTHPGGNLNEIIKQTKKELKKDKAVKNVAINTTKGNQKLQNKLVYYRIERTCTWNYG